MWHLYLDESGDLGFNFNYKSPSKFFSICILLIKDREAHLALRNAVKKTLKRKFKNYRRGVSEELKGSKMDFSKKCYFWSLVKDISFYLYTISLNKRDSILQVADNQHRIYNYITHSVIEQIPLHEAKTRIQLVVDKSKGRHEIRQFNQYISANLEGLVDPRVPVSIDHLTSHQEYGLQAVDLFTWGVHRKYEKGDSRWYDLFSEKISFDKAYP